MPRVLKPKPTKEEILAIEGSVPVEMAARYLGRPKDFIYNGLQKQARSAPHTSAKKNGATISGRKRWLNTTSTAA